MTEMQALEMYRELLDTTYGPVTIGDLEYDASRVLEAVDAVAFRAGFLEYLDAHGIEIE